MADFTKTPRPFYPPLSSHKREIRLLNLEPGSKDEALQCRLSVISLDSNPSYEALSYCWGNGTSEVLVDGHSVLIPKNLEAALRRFRHTDRELTVWADAICIDQSRVEERNAQVALMADIYRTCERCLIFIGNTLEDDAGRLQELLGAFSKKHHFNQPDAPRINSMFGISRLSVMYFNRAAWWERIWVVQEVMLAPESLVVYGSFEMLFSDLIRAVEFLDEHDIGSASGPTRHETDDLCHCMDSIKITFIWADLLALRDHVYRLLELGRPQPRPGANSASVPVQGDPGDIVDVLLSVRHRDCTDPRDKIFGILSLVQDWRSWPPIMADYSKNALQVFTEFAALMLHSSECGPKTLLLARGAEFPSRPLTGLPSWAPDWFSPGSAYDKYLMIVERQTASQPLPPTIQPVSVLNPTTIILHHARRIGKITAVSIPGEPIHKTYGHATDGADYRRFTHMMESWRLFAGVQNPITATGVLDRYLPEGPSTGHILDPQPLSPSTDSGSWDRLISDIQRSHYTVDFMPQVQAFLDAICFYQHGFRQMDADEEAFYRTLIRNTYPLHLRQPEYHKEALCILRVLLIFCDQFIDPDRVLTRLNSVVLSKIAETLEMVEIWGRRLFRTEGGLLGSGSEMVSPGDEVFCFEGVETPFVLRRLAGTGTAVTGNGEAPRYTLVGHCYVDGLGAQKEGDGWEEVKEVYLE
jgi:hypothetical protein